MTDPLATLLHREFTQHEDEDGVFEPCALCEARAARLLAAGVTLTQPQPDTGSLRDALRRLVDSAVLVPMAAEDDDDVAECWVVHPEPLEEARAALAAAPQPQPDAGSAASGATQGGQP